MRKKRIIVLYGGTSKERPVSLKTGKNVFLAISSEKYNKELIDTKTEITKLIKLILRNKVDLAIIALHGKGGEDGTIQGFLETLKIPYLGSGVLSSSLSMDKNKTKIILKHHSILTPKWQIHDKNSLKIAKITVPCVIKPITEGSSFGVTIVKHKNMIPEATRKAFKIEDVLMIEEYIEGREITVGVIGNKNPHALPIIEIIPPKEFDFFDYEAKYSGKTEEIVPADLNEKISNEIKLMALKIFKIMNCQDLARIDMIIDKNNKIHVIEINTLPGMTSTSLLPKEATAENMNFEEFIETLIKEKIKDV